jgi:hypothetical protein
MRWVRARVRYGAWCALFALAFQFALSFGHMHGFATGSSFGALSLTDLSGDGNSTAIPDAPAVPQKPPALGFDFCAICAVANMAGNALVAAAPSLPMPVAVRPILHSFGSDAAATASPQRLFQARAPPRA